MESDSPTMIGVGHGVGTDASSTPDGTADDPDSLRDSANDLAEELAAEYELGPALGQGGFGTVFRARRRATGTDVAIKVLRIQSGWEPRFVKSYIARFEREAELCAGLEHPNIVRLLDRGQTRGGACYAVYELVPGRTLRAHLVRERTLSPVRTAEIMGQVLAALACAQQKGVVHRDLKPDNIMLTEQDGALTVKVLDFGIGTVTLEARGRDFQSLTLTRETIGTPSYSAPEQLRGDAPTTKTDLYAWGLVFVECLTGRAMVRGATLAEIYHQHLSPEELPLPVGLAGHPIAEFLRRVLRKRPDQRSGDAAALLLEFQKLRLNDLVGKLGEEPLGTAETARLSPPTHARGTEVVQPAALRQVTVLACSLMVVPSPESTLELEVLDAIHADQLGLCRDTVSRYGGVVVASVCDQLVTCFGHPVASDTDARRAARTALELAQDVRHRSARLRASHDVALEFRIGLHTGTVVSKELEHPDGITPSIAMRLASLAPANAIVVSDATRRMLEHRVEFESAPRVQVNGIATPTPTFLLVAERHAEALSFRPGQPSAGTFVGRRDELSELERAWAGARAGIPHGVLVSGEAGIGKSRLVREFLQTLRERGEVCYECRCLAEHQNAALSPIIELLRQELGLRDAASPAEASRIVRRRLEQYGARLDHLLPIYCSWLSVPCPDGFGPPPLAPYRQRELFLQSITEILPKLGGDRPLVLLVEDLHWADVTTLDLLQALAKSRGASHTLVILTARQEFRPPAELEVTEVALERLLPSTSLDLIRSLLGETALTDAELGAIVQRTDGIPLFIEELTRMLVDDHVRPHDSRSDTARRQSTIPITLRDSLNERLDRLGSARETAQLAAALGREFDRFVLLSAAERDEATVAADLDKLLHANILYQRRQVGTSNYVFRHALIRDAAYDSMPSPLRRATHSRIAGVLETEFFDATARADLARHYAAAEEFEPAVRHGIAAAEASLERSGNAEALAQGREVASFITRLPAGPDRVESELRINGVMAQALMAIHGWASTEVREQAERSRALLPESTARHHTVATLFALFMHHHVASDRAACRDVVGELVKFADEAGDRALRAVAATAQGVCFHAEGRFVEAAEWLERALSLYDPAQDREQGAIYGLDCRAWAAAQLALVEWNTGKTRRSFEHAAEAIAWSREIDHVPSLGIALLYISQIHQFERDKPSVLATTGELLEASAAYGLPAFEGYAATIRAWAQGDYESVSAIIGILERMNCNLILTYYGSYLADIEAERGRYDAAVAQIEHCLALCQKLDEHCFEPELHRRWASYELMREEPRKERALAELVTACELARRFGMLRLEAAANLELQRGFGGDPALAARLDEIVAARPDLEVVVRSFTTAIVHSPVRHEASAPH